MSAAVNERLLNSQLRPWCVLPGMFHHLILGWWTHVAEGDPIGTSLPGQPPSFPWLSSMEQGGRWCSGFPCFFKISIYTFAQLSRFLRDTRLTQDEAKWGGGVPPCLKQCQQITEMPSKDDRRFESSFSCRNAWSNSNSSFTEAEL